MDNFEKSWNFKSPTEYEPCVIVYVICFFIAFVNLIQCMMSPKQRYVISTLQEHTRKPPLPVDAPMV